MISGNKAVLTNSTQLAFLFNVLKIPNGLAPNFTEENVHKNCFNSASIGPTETISSGIKPSFALSYHLFMHVRHAAHFNKQIYLYKITDL